MAKPPPPLYVLQGSPAQQALVQQALDRCDFPWELLRLRLQATTGRSTIPVEWADLSRWAQAEGDAVGHQPGVHPLAPRGRTLGLAWYSGKVSLDLSLEAEPELAGEVFLAEAAHMTDFFWMSDAQRAAVYAVFHGGQTAEHGHGWFDVGGYRDWVGEAYMGGFIQAFSDYPVTIAFTHAAPEAIGPQVRQVLGLHLVHGCRVSRLFHRLAHRPCRLPSIRYPHRNAALAVGRRPCPKCNP
jgi:hypothetical protein